MNPSNAALMHSQKGMHMVSFGELSQRFKERSLYPKDGRAAHVEGKAFVDLWRLGTAVQVESHINDLVVAVRNAGTHELRDEKMKEAVRIARESTDAFELHYLTSMFIHHRKVMRALARNSHIDEKTQMILATDDELKQDPEIQIGLAHNLILSDAVMVKMLNECENQFVQMGLAWNAASQARSGTANSPYVKICNMLAKSFDVAVRAEAIGGIRDPEILREVASSNSVFLAPRVLEAVATNDNTPTDVLHDLSVGSMPKLQSMFAIRVAENARRTLASKNHKAAQPSDLPTPSPA